MNRDQLRARNSFRFVTSLVQRSQGQEKGAELLDAFLGLSRKLPVMLQTNGLLATWGHLLAKARKGVEFEETAQSLTAHLQSLGLTGDGTPAALFHHWIDAQTGLSSSKLRQLTAEAVEYAVWLKRAAEALCDAAPVAPQTSGVEVQP